MICPRCKTKNPDNTQYCHKCGYQIYTLNPVDVKICPNCGKMNPLDQDECLNCHTSLNNTPIQKTWNKNFSTPSDHRLSPSSKLILTLIIITFGFIIGISALHSNNYISSSIKPFTITRRYNEPSSATKKFYIAINLQTPAQRDHQMEIFRGARYSNYHQLNHVSVRQVKAKYQAIPTSRLQIKMSPAASQKINLSTIPKNLNTTHSIKIQYTWQSRHWYNVTTDRKHQTLIVHGPDFTDYISIGEAEF
ncbi:MAG TPA: zinc ribbon domain-containing protein [Limosilactobacillus coleohominis]|nr:zinc ribbon domain-containing protein [Limosilactobacillus coleohominis]